MPPRNLLEALGQTVSGFGQQVPTLLQQDVGIRQSAERNRLQQASDQARFDQTQSRNQLSAQQGAERLKISQGQLDLALDRLAETQRRNAALEGQFGQTHARLSGSKPTTGPTLPERLRATNEVLGQQQSGTLGEAVRFLSSKGQTPGPNFGIGDLEREAFGPSGLQQVEGVTDVFTGDNTLFDLLGQYRNIGSPSHRQAFQADDSLQYYRPSMFGGGQQQPVQPFTPQPQQLQGVVPQLPGQIRQDEPGGAIQTEGTLGRDDPTRRLIGPPMPSETPLDRWGRSIYPDWDLLNTQDKTELFNASGSN